MSSITSSTYPTTGASGASDLIVIVRAGQVMKLTMSGLQDYVQGLIDDSLGASFIATTAQLNSLTSDVNVTGKFLGKFIFNTSTSKPVYSVGSAAASVWVDATGATAHTPV